MLQANDECRLVTRILSSKQGLYQQGIPLHHLPAARRIEYDGSGSSIFVSTAEDFKKLTPLQIQQVFRDRHILVVDVPVDEPLEFDKAGLMTLGALHSQREFQGVLQYAVSGVANQG